MIGTVSEPRLFGVASLQVEGALAGGAVVVHCQAKASVLIVGINVIVLPSSALSALNVAVMMPSVTTTFST